MTEWPEVASKVATILQQRCDEIRRDIPVDQILSAAKDSVSSAGVDLTNSSLSDIPVEAFVQMANEINGAHRRMIREAAGRLGIVESEMPHDFKVTYDSRNFLFHGDDESDIRMSVEGMTIRIEKETAMKVAVLGRLP